MEAAMRQQSFMRALVLGALMSGPVALSAQVQQGEKLDLGVAQKIRDEEMNRSKIPDLSTQLFDKIGQRLTGSSSLRTAQQWASQTLTSWGLQKVQIEPWDSLFGRGWERVSYSARWIEPLVQPLYGMPLAWTGSTKGTVTCNAMVVEIRDTMDLAKYEGKLKNQCILLFRAGNGRG